MNTRRNRVAVAVIVALGLGGNAAGQCTLNGDLDGNGVVNGADLGLLLIQWGDECPAVIDAVNPSSGPLAGGTAITITGSNLGVVQSVTIGGLDAIHVVQVDASTITAMTPAAKSFGAKDVVVNTNVQSSTLSSGFTYYDPLAWAEVLELLPDPAVITNSELRDRINATGLPWRVRDVGTGIEMLLVPPGSFMMGCSASDQSGCNSNGSEHPVHEVTLTQAFYLGRYEVTQAQWTALMGSNPSEHQSPSVHVPAEQVPNRPVDGVSWDMIQGFEAQTDLRLPTEAEWEYACRAQTDSAYNLPPDGTDDEVLSVLVAWYFPGSEWQTRPVGQKLANNLGLHDMHGNVAEWVEDWYSQTYYFQSPAVNPTGPISGTYRVLRGGRFGTNAAGCRASLRVWGYPNGSGFSWGSGLNSVGFRAARTP